MRSVPGKSGRCRSTSSAEKFRRVIEAYQIENEYGRTMEAYGATINVEGADRIVDVLKVGRVALVMSASAQLSSWISFI